MARSRRWQQTVAASAAHPAAIGCAIYTRKSTTEGLDRDFTTLDNQRQSAEAYVLSQQHEGWTALPDRYDDGGFSGGNTERPALKRLLADIEGGRVDTIVVYKLDRLSRSLIDFLNLHQFLDQHSVGLVSVTEQLNTTSAHGRMMVNVLLSFAQYERELIGERTSDKICAARRRGKWTGGSPPLGYDVVPEGGRIVVNKSEARQVRAIFDLYLDLGSIMKVVEELNRRGWRRKSWTTKTGHTRHGSTWCKRTVRQLLVDPLYIGRQKLGDETFKGEHAAIVPTRLFAKAQDILSGNRGNGGAGQRNRHGALLRGLVHCPACDAPMNHAQTRKRTGKAYRYYRCGAANKRGAQSCPTRSVSAPKIERFVLAQIRHIGQHPDLQVETFEQAVAQAKAGIRGLKAESKRLERDLRQATKPVQSLVDTLSGATGPARVAVHAELEKTQEHVQTIENRLTEITTEKAAMESQTFDQADVADALAAFDPLWEVLLTPEKERVLRQLIDRVDYDGAAGKLEIHWRLAGFGELADEIGGSDQ